LRIIGRMKMRNEGEMKIIVYQMEMRFKFWGKGLNEIFLNAKISWDEIEAVQRRLRERITYGNIAPIKSPQNYIISLK
jgi:hypothetical protein